MSSNYSSLEKIVTEQQYITQEGARIVRRIKPLAINDETTHILFQRKCMKGILFLDNDKEYSFRNKKWDIVIINPPIEIRFLGNLIVVHALNKRGEILLNSILLKLKHMERIKVLECKKRYFISCQEGTNESSEFEILREINELFAISEDSFLGLYGPIGNGNKNHSPAEELIFYLPDELVAIDSHSAFAYQISYDFKIGNISTVHFLRRDKTRPLEDGGNKFMNNNPIIFTKWF